MNFDLWERHFAKEPRSTETVAVPRDVFDFLIEAYEAYQTMGDDTPLEDIGGAQLLSLDLLREIRDQHKLA